MTTSFSNIQPGFFELSPCRVTYGGIDLGATDKVTVKIENKLAPLKADQLGDTDIDNKYSGMNFTVETSLDEVQLKTNWKTVFPANKLVTEGGNTMFYFDSQIGASMLALAQPLILHPLSKPDGDKSTDFYIFLATAMPSSELLYSSSEQQKLKVTFKVYPDFTTQPPRFMIYGDPAVGLIAATAGAATAGTGNVGNGTVTSVAVTNTAKTELITLQCVTAITDSGTFNVQGSFTGPMGLATVGIGFNSPGDEISFIINDGLTDFAVGDNFTIQTTAANYV